MMGQKNSIPALLPLDHGRKEITTTVINTTPTPVILPKKKKQHPLQHLLAGGTAGFVESSCCHPLDTIKTRMQLGRQAITSPISAASLSSNAISAPSGIVSVSISLGPFGTAHHIIKREGFFSLYKGLSAVYTGIIPKMAIRFLSFEVYSEHMSSFQTIPSGYIPFFAGLLSGLTEAIMIVTPAEVCKIRLQSQNHSMNDPTQIQHRKYTNVIQTTSVIIREEGFGALYKGVFPTMLRQGINQAVNFSFYQFGKRTVMEYQEGRSLQRWQHLYIGGISGAFGPMVNNPLDVVKTRMQCQVVVDGQEVKYRGILQSCNVIIREEGVWALWKGLTPRLMRIVPGQAITFMTYEAVGEYFTNMGLFQR